MGECGVRVTRHFAFVDLAGFTAFTDEHGDEEAVEVLGRFRNAVRKVGSDHAVRVAKWLGDGCMLVSVDADKLVDAVLDLVRRCDDECLALRLHVGMAGGDVILLEGDDYTGRAVNLASRLAGAAGPNEVLTTPELAKLAPGGAEPAGPFDVKGIAEPVDAWLLRVTLPASSA